MDAFAFDHMTAWIEKQFVGYVDDDDIPQIISEMRTVYERDPEYYGDAGWWRVYDATQHSTT